MIFPVALLMAGCASVEETSNPSMGTQINGPTPAIFWDVIDGGDTGNMVIGVNHVRFMRPVAVAARGNFVYVVDAGKDMLYRYERDIGTLSVVKDLRPLVTGDVTDLYVDGDLSFYITDTDGSRVLQFDPEGNLIQVYADQINMARPVSVTVDEVRGQVLVGDGFNDFVLVFNRLAVLQGAIGRRGIEDGEFTNIQAIDTGPDGVYVACRLGHRVQVMSRDGDFIKAFEENTVTFPLAIAVDQDKRAFVADYLDNSIKVYVDGRLVDTLGGSGSSPGRFKRITSLWLDEGSLYVADSLNGRIQVAHIAPLSSGQVTEP
jgi:DNA-binding beta-propeller fold protein YncE